MAHYPFYTHNLSLVGVCVKRIGKLQRCLGLSFIGTDGEFLNSCPLFLRCLWHQFSPNTGLSNLTSGLLNLCRSVILAFPFNVGFVSTGPFVVYFDEDGADQAFE